MAKPHKYIAAAVSGQVRMCVELRDSHPMEKLMADIEPMEFAVCLGPHRCMQPATIEFEPNKQHCPFCRWYPSDRNSGRVHRQDEFVVNFLKGN